jgi:hypothetical protein
VAAHTPRLIETADRVLHLTGSDDARMSHPVAHDPRAGALA